jgi:Domain of unknown function (DUF4296)
MKNRKNHWFLAIFSLLLLAACQTKVEQPTMTREELAAIVGDLFIADAAVTSGYGPLRDTMHAYYYDQVFELHGLDQAKLKHELDLYARSYEEMDSIIRMAERRLKSGTME